MNPYLFGCCVLMALWLITFWMVRRRKKERDLHEFWWASFTCFLMGITEPLYVPEYWDPPSVLKFYRWDLESFIFCFAIGGIASVFSELPRVKRVMYAIDYALWFIFKEIVLRVRRVFLGRSDDAKIANVTFTPVVLAKDQIRIENMILVAFFVGMFGMTAQLNLNIIYDAAIVCLSTAIFIWWRRPRLRRQIVGGGVSFTFLYAIVLVVDVNVYPDFFSYWNLTQLSGIFIAKAPLEEYLFAFTFGAFWAPLYEAWKNEKYAPYAGPSALAARNILTPTAKSP